MEQETVQSPRIQNNHADQPCYIVDYDEDQWLKYNREQQDNCFETWERKAKPLGAVFIVLRLFPDPLFPMGEHTAPYVFRTIPVERETFDPVTVKCRLSAEIHADTMLNALDGERMKLIAAARQKLAMQAMASKGCSYDIWYRDLTGAPTVVERGRL